MHGNHYQNHTEKIVELRRTNTGNVVVSFTLAVQRDKENTDFINCVAWDGTAELLEKYTHKGDRLGLEGRIQTRTYQDNQGKNVYVTEVLARRVELLESKPKEPKQEPTNRYPFDINDDDIAF